MSITLTSAAPSVGRIAPLHVGKRIPPPYAGIEAHIDMLLRSFGKLVDATLVASAGHAGGGSDPAPAPAPYRIVPAQTFGTFASVPLSPGVYTGIAREFRSGRANLLHLHAPNPWGDIAALAARRDLPVVLTWHSDIVVQKRLLRLYRPLQRRAIDRADRVIVFTPKHFESSTQLKLPGIERKLAAIPMGIDFTRLDSLPGDGGLIEDLDRWCAGRPLVLTVGRHVYYKGYEYLLDAMAALRSEAVLVMVGTGPLSLPLKERARTLGVEERVRFVGEVDHRRLVALLHRCDVFTLPSIEPSEAFGIATAEAMACAKPTVVCELGNGVNFLTRHGETGLSVPARDHLALADALDALVLDDSLRARMGAAADRWVRSEFSIERMREGTLALYRELL